MDKLKKLSAQVIVAARERRAYFYKLHLKGVSCADLARDAGMSRQRMAVILAKAAKEIKAGFG